MHARAPGLLVAAALLIASGCCRGLDLSGGGTSGTASEATGEVARYARHGISFDYPKEMTIEDEVDEGFTSVHVEASDSTLAIIQIYEVPVGLDVVKTTLTDAMRSEMATRGASFDAQGDRTVKRRVQGQEIEGKELAFRLLGLPTKCEIYAFELKGRVIALMLQRTDDDAVAAARRFQVIVGSLG